MWTSYRVFTSFFLKKNFIFVDLFLLTTKEPHLANFGSFSMDTPKKGVPIHQNLDIPFASPFSFIYRPFRVISSLHPSPTSLLIAFPTLTFALFSSFSRCPLRRSRLSFGAGQLLSPLYSAWSSSSSLLFMTIFDWVKNQPFRPPPQPNTVELAIPSKITWLGSFFLVFYNN